MKFPRLKYILPIFFAALSLISGQPRRETRAVWIVTNFHLDWPPRNANVEELKSSLDEIFFNIRSKNFNTVYFQSLIKGSALYKSSILPEVPYFTAPGSDTLFFDPLKYAILLAHKYGLEIHAWVNTARVFSGDETEFLDNPKHVVNTHPEWIEKIKQNGETSLWLNFGNPRARFFMVSALVELAERYPVDGIQLDFIRYPGHNISDMPEYIAFGDTLDLDDWRRENIDKFVHSLHDSLRAVNHFLKIGATPFGIYKNLPDAEGSEAFYTVYQDSRLWLKNGWVDYLTPQIYWDINHNPRFDALAVDWVKHSYGRNIVLGTAPYKKQVYKELDKIITLSREIKANGLAFFRYGFIRNRSFPEFDSFVFPAQMPWLDPNVPLPPTGFTATAGSSDNRISLSWKKSLSENIKYYSLYSIDEEAGFESKQLVSLFSGNSNFVVYTIKRPSKIKYKYELCSVSKLWNESKPSSKKPEIVLSRLNNLIKEPDLIPLRPLLIKGENRLTLCYFAENEFPFKIEVSNKKGTNSLSVNLHAGINYIDLPGGVNFSSVKLINLKTNHEITLRNNRRQ